MLTALVIMPILVAVFLYLFPFEKIGRVISIIIQLGIAVASIYLFVETRTYEMVAVIGGYGTLGITLRADSLASVFILMTAFIFLMTAIYSYSNDKSKLFWFLFFIWEASLIGVFLSGDIFNIFVLTEVGTVVVSVLIMYNRKERSMYDGLVYLMINVVIIQFYLLGLGYIYRMTGALNLTSIAIAFDAIPVADQVLPYAFIMTFVALKCAVFPVFSWLPKAHGTPGASAAVSAVLSGLHIKSGLYLFLRFQDVFSMIDTSMLFLIVGIFTAFVGVIMSIAQTDIKLILAYSTIAQVGLIIAGFSIDNVYNFTGALYHIVTHGVFKTALFMGAGLIMHFYGTRDITKIKGVLKVMPITCGAMIFAILGIIGAPFFGGSVSKYFLMHDIGWVLMVALLLINLGTIIIFIKFSRMFFGNYGGENKFYNIWGQQVPIMILGLLSLALGIWGETFIYIMFGDNIVVSFGSYIEKAGYFVVSLIAGILIVTFHMKKEKNTFSQIKYFELGFRGMVAAIGMLFALIIVFILWRLR